MAELQILKSISQRRQERQEMQMQMFLTRKNQSRKRLLQTMDGKLDMVETTWLMCRDYEETKERTGCGWRKKFLVVEKWLPKLGRYCVQKTFAYKSSNVSVHSWWDRRPTSQKANSFQTWTDTLRHTTCHLFVSIGPWMYLQHSRRPVRCCRINCKCHF